jgi:hypothetical protein
MGNPGAVATNYYQGTRSEYLAQYVFSMFGTAAQVPHEADYGFDLACTLTRTTGGRGEPYAYYSVQIKSEPKPWVFGVPGSVKWILQYPAPLLFCLVDKDTTKFTIYQLLARFQAAVLPDLPDSLTLVLGEPGTTKERRPRIGWDREGNLELGPPILQFTISDLMKDEDYAEIRKVLDYWISTDLRNIIRQQMGMRTVSGPTFYETNKVPPESGFGAFSMTTVPDDVRERASRTAAEHLNWLGQVMEQRGDLAGALLAALLVRHLLPGQGLDRSLGFSPTSLYARLGPTARKAFPDIAGAGTALSPFDDILAHLKQVMDDTAHGGQGTPGEAP